ncbi:ribosome maturation factor RimM [Phormidesmis priestleyi]|uniref:ribosome maturation factor RimM n=1 Tax=Phormidesmis priestleyi TaxID=268141 RepID=UPI00083A7905|nr:ribosome maturation factor RimM [Phormidesmis priestleyi]
MVDELHPQYFSVQTSQSPYLEIGKIVSTQGLKGEVRVYPDSDFPERFIEPGKRWILRSNATQPEEIQLVKGRYLDGKGLYVVQFAGVNTCEEAEALRGSKILVLASDRLDLEEGEFHVADLIGLQVFDQATQTQVGTVVDILSAGNDLLEIQREGSESRVLIPFVMAIVPIVDLKQNRIEITPPPGLID